MKKNLIDLYTDYCICSTEQITATGLSNMTNQKISHDSITRLLNSNKVSGKEIWGMVKPYISKYSNEKKDGILIVDDTIINKPHSKENDLICWHYDHSCGKTVKGINLLSLLYSTPDFNCPATCELIQKTSYYSDLKTKVVKRKSPVSKNELFREMISTSIKNNIDFNYILGDSWFGSSKNMNFIDNQDKKFIFAQKSNRLASVKINGKFQDSQAISSLELQEGVVYNVLLNGMDKPLNLIKQIFKNGDSVCGTIYLVTNDLALDFSSLIKLYQRRWKIEEYHKSLKSNLGLAKSQSCTVTTQSNHIFLTLLAYVKLETISIKSKTNHFATKNYIYIRALITSYKEIQKTNQQFEILPMAA